MSDEISRDDYMRGTVLLSQMLCNMAGRQFIGGDGYFDVTTVDLEEDDE